jgi:hypothetical protein
MNDLSLTTFPIYFIIFVLKAIAIFLVGQVVVNIEVLNRLLSSLFDPKD